MMFERATSIAEAIAAKAAGATLLAGGTSVVDLMQLGVGIPQKLVYLEPVGLDFIRHSEGGGMTVGALCPQSRLAKDAGCRQWFSLLSTAILSGASGQIRNMATVGGNLLQRTRCFYFRDFAAPCNKRNPGSGCPAYHAPGRSFALFGRSADCIAAFPSDQAAALVALDARVEVQGQNGTRSMPLEAFYRLPGDTPELDNELAGDEVLVAIEVPGESAGLRSAYVKIRDRQAYVFAVVSVAAALRIDRDRITHARIVLGNVAHKPWRAFESENLLLNQTLSGDLLESAAELAVAEAYRSPGTEGKIRLTRAAVSEALHQAWAGGSK